eukprot:GEMP01073328.1.p1 GENE.GEMP01073328.1~~GEMP01073328.1.p1  ORF type:complete len:221 (+),score=42.96 GEMP01073328.1:156-818(+)
MVKLCTYRTTQGVTKLGAIVEDEVLDLSSTGYHSLDDVLAHDGLGKVRQAIPSARKEANEFSYLAPVRHPDKVLCVGLNYFDHCKEQNVPVPKEPIFFNKFASSLAGAYDPVPLHNDVTKLDWEVELVVVIGKKCFDVSEEEAMDCVFGYAVGHDVSARDWQLEKNGGQWLLGKARLRPVRPRCRDEGRGARYPRSRHSLQCERQKSSGQQYQPDGFQNS